MKLLNILIEQAKKWQECPRATKDLKYNTMNRDFAIKTDWINYGPLNLEDEDYWVKVAKKWKTTPEVAAESKCKNCVAFDISPRMLECMPGNVDKEGYLGYCWMHHFKCHSERSCNTWATGGPIDDDKNSYIWAKRNEGSLE